jgi:tetratricopeptide (TPR) repeat protein
LMCHIAGVEAAEMSDGVGARLLAARTARGFSQRQLAEPAYTAAYVSAVELGHRRPSAEALRFFAERLGIDDDELITGIPAGLAAELRLHLTEARRHWSAGAPAVAVAAYQQVRERASAAGLTGLVGLALQGLGRCAQQAGELTQAIAHYSAAERELAEHPLPTRVPSIVGQATCHALAGRLREAVFLLTSTIDALERADLTDPDAVLLLHSGLVSPYTQLGLHADAARAAEVAIALAPLVSDPERVAAMHIRVAATYLTQGKPSLAEASLTKAHDLYSRLDLRTELGYCRWSLGYTHARTGKLDEAAREFAGAREVLVAAGAAFQVLRLDCEIADVLRRQGHPDEAKVLLNNTLAAIDSADDLMAVSDIHRQLGLLLATEGDVVTAENHYRAAIALLEQADAALEIAVTCRLLGDLLTRLGRHPEATAVYRTGLLATEGASPLLLGTDRPAPSFHANQ